MLDPAIQEFLDERKALWLKPKLTGNTTEEEKLKLEQEASVRFSLTKWLPKAAKRAKQLSLVSHPEKFSHPRAKGTTPVIAPTISTSDGFLRTGNVEVKLDTQGNAATFDVFKFLSLNLKDGKTILTHLETQTALIQKQLTVAGVSFTEIKQGLLAIKQNHDSSIITSAASH